MSFYYLVASLPNLQFESKPQITMAEFLSECQRLLSPQDYEAILRAVQAEDEDTQQPTVRAWLDFVRALRNEMVWFRASEYNKDPQEYVRGERQAANSQIVDALATAMKAADPLSAEKIIDQLAWNKIEELGQQHFFDLDQLIVYGLKLKILQRDEVINSPAGRDHFAQFKKAAALKY